MKKIILASQSPRRKQLLAAMGVLFETIPSSFEEKLDDARDPELVAKELALGKAMDVAINHPDAYVIGSDTIVTIDGRQLEKPLSESDAKHMLHDLAGRINYVSTGVALVCINDNVRLVQVDTTAVHFKPYDKSAVDEYVATGDPMDKAGAYGIQHPKCAALIEFTEGRYDSIIGLPTEKLAAMLSEIGIEARSLSYDGTVAALGVPIN